MLIILSSTASNVKTQVVNAASTPAPASGGAKFCSNCGTAASGGKFCSNCGKQL